MLPRLQRQTLADRRRARLDAVKFYMHEVEQKKADLERAQEQLQRAMEALAEQESEDGLFNG